MTKKKDLLSEIEKCVKETPNNFDLGSKVRFLVRESKKSPGEEKTENKKLI